MENATKALLIAAAVLIVILLIAFGMRIFNSTSETTESAQKTMDATAITTFNTQFTGFLNKEITATQASTLEQKIIASNAVNNKHTVSFTYNGAGTYEVTNYDGGYIKSISKQKQN